MYKKFYNFSEKPFNTTPDTKFFFPSSKHQEALNSLIYAVEERKGFVVITGEIGAGKTTVSRSLLNKLTLNTKVALITNASLSPRELIAEILNEFEVEHQGGTKQKLLSYLNDYLIKQLSAGVNVVLIIDEAQNLSTKVLEEVRMLSNLETEKEKLIQIILMGQPDLRQKLNNPKLEQFRQRIAVYYHLNSLNKEETREYIYHRLSLVNSNGYKNIFSSGAIDLIYSHSRGIPRLINLFCDSALLSGFVYELKEITDKIIIDVVKEREINSLAGSTGVSTTFCCVKCSKFDKCALKWERGSKKKNNFAAKIARIILIARKEEMGKITDALKKAAEERISRLEKLDSNEEVKYQFIAKKTVDSKIDPRIVTFYESSSPVAEQFRTLRTNLLALNTNKPIKVVTVTSSINGEGKTVSSINLAISMAQDLNKKKILLIDADLRRGRVHKYLGITPETGLSDLLADGSNPDEAFVNIGINNLTILPAGKIPHNPAELLGSIKFKNFLSLLKEKYDFIILDSPPIIPVTDSGLIGVLTDGVIMVIQAGRTQRGIIKHAEGLLKQAQTKMLGYIMTNVQYHIPAYIYRYL